MTHKIGRPPVDPLRKKINCPVKLPAWLITWMDAQPESRAVLIEKAMQQFFRLRPPDKKP